MQNCVLTRILILFILLVTAMFCNAQTPTVTTTFDKLFWSENFDSSNANWNIVFNAENLLIVQEGEYIMHRKSNVSPYAVMANISNDFSSFRMVTSIKLDKTSAIDGSIGIIFMAQPEGKGGFIFELNNNSYRLRQLTNGTYKYLTATAKTNGWRISDLVKGFNQPNLIEIRTAENRYDIFLNNNLLLSFNEPVYSSGSIGFIIGPSSKGKADFLYLFTQKEKTNTDGVENNNSSGTDVMSLVESIITLKTQANKLSENNEDLKQIIQAMRSGEKENEQQKENFEKQLKDLQSQLKKSSTTHDSLQKSNTDLLRYKEMVMGNDNGDLVINLSKNLKKEKTNSDDLNALNKVLRDSLTILKNDLKTQKGKGNSSEKDNNTTNFKNKIDSIPAKKTDKKEFVLPKEN